MNYRVIYIVIDPVRAPGWYWCEEPGDDLRGPYEDPVAAERAATADDKEERES